MMQRIIQIGSMVYGSESESKFPATRLFVMAGLCKTQSEARRLAEGGGAYINGKRISPNAEVMLVEGEIWIVDEGKN